jgi:hypothetical protein
MASYIQVPALPSREFCEQLRRQCLDPSAPERPVLVGATPQTKAVMHVWGYGDLVRLCEATQMNTSA